jgi:transposase
VDQLGWTERSMQQCPRMRYDPRTQAYLARRRAEGKSDREIRRCIKRYIARQLYRTLTAAINPNIAASA